jgi:AraC-like DNA-binding protein
MVPARHSEEFHDVQEMFGGVTMVNNAIGEEHTFSTLESDLMVPSQFFDRIKVEHSAQPEKRLMLAVMEDAISTFQKSVRGLTRRQRRLLRETEEWMSEADNHWPFSFENICAALDIEPAYLRRGLKDWKGMLLAQYEQTSATGPFSPFRRVSGRRHTLSAGRAERAPKAKAA